MRSVFHLDHHCRAHLDLLRRIPRVKLVDPLLGIALHPCILEVNLATARWWRCLELQRCDNEQCLAALETRPYIKVGQLWQLWHIFEIFCIYYN